MASRANPYEPRGPDGSLERKPLEDRHVRVARARSRSLCAWRRGRDEEHRPEHTGAGRVRPDGQDPRRRVQAARRRERPRPERHTSHERSGVQGHGRRRRRRCLDHRRRPERPLAVRSWQLEPDRDERHAVLVQFEIAGDPTDAIEKVGPVVDKVGEVQKAHPQLFVGEFGDASAPAGADEAAGKDLAKAGMLSLPITLIILAVAFGALVAAGIPLLLGLTAVFATFGLIALPSQVLPMAMEVPAIVLLIGLAVGVDYSMFYLRRVREERAAGRSTTACDRGGRCHLRPLGADLGPDRDGGHGRHVPHRRQDVRLVRRCDDHGRRDRGARLADRPAGAALEARRPGRPGRFPFLGGAGTVARGRFWDAIINRVLKRPGSRQSSPPASCSPSPPPALSLHMVKPGPDTFPQSIPMVKAYRQACSRPSPARRFPPTSS